MSSQAASRVNNLVAYPCPVPLDRHGRGSCPTSPSRKSSLFSLRTTPPTRLIVDAYHHKDRLLDRPATLQFVIFTLTYPLHRRGLPVPLRCVGASTSALILRFVVCADTPLRAVKLHSAPKVRKSYLFLFPATDKSRSISWCGEHLSSLLR